MKDYFWGSEKESPNTTTPHDFATDSLGPTSLDNNIVEVSHNTIYYYSGVTRPKVLQLNKNIHSLNINMLSKTLSLGFQPQPIKLHINSYGGSVFAAMAAVDHIKASKVPIHSIIDGCAASAATLMSVVATKRFMHKNACMLIHQISGLMWGKFQEMQDDMENSQMVMEKIKNIYRENTRIPKEEIDNILKHDLWWEAEKCLQYGLIDEII